MWDDRMTPALILAGAALAAVALLCFAGLRAWRGWLDFKRYELAAARGTAETPDTGVRIEMADLKERLRKLEAIATGVDP
jgi:hypothetical protein